MKKLLLILSVALSAKMHSAIIVTSINQGFSTNDCNIDLDINGIDDFKIFRPAFNTIDVGCQHGNALVQVNGGGNAIAYMYNATIGASTWSNTSAALMNAFYGQGLRYIGVKIIVAGQTYYGWVSVAVASDANTFTVYEYAYQNTPNTTIKAGEIDVIGIFENQIAKKNFTVYPNPVSVNGTLFFDKNLNQDMSITLFDFIGKEILHASLKNNTFNFSEANLCKGIYFIRVFENKQYIGDKKIVVE